MATVASSSPGALVATLAGKCVNSMALHVVIFELSFVHITIHEHVATISRLLGTRVAALVDISIAELSVLEVANLARIACRRFQEHWFMLVDLRLQELW